MRLIFKSPTQVVTADIEDLATREACRAKEPRVLRGVSFAEPVTVILEQSVQTICESIINSTHPADKRSSLPAGTTSVLREGEFSTHPYALDLPVQERADHHIAKKLASHCSQRKAPNRPLESHGDRVPREIVSKSSIDRVHVREIPHRNLPAHRGHPLLKLPIHFHPG